MSTSTPLPGAHLRGQRPSPAAVAQSVGALVAAVDALGSGSADLAAKARLLTDAHTVLTDALSAEGGR
jgi:hypothetical protein